MRILSYLSPSIGEKLFDSQIQALTVEKKMLQKRLDRNAMDDMSPARSLLLQGKKSVVSARDIPLGLRDGN
jgi:hypothetical protein